MKKTYLFFTALSLAFTANAQSLPQVPFTSDADHFSATFLSVPDKKTANNCNSYISVYGNITCSIKVYQENSDTAKMGDKKFIDYLKDKYGKKIMLKDKKFKLAGINNDNAFFCGIFADNYKNSAYIHVFMYNNKLYYILYIFPGEMMSGDIESFMAFDDTYFESFKLN